MTDRDTLVIDLTPEKRQRIEALAHEHGFDTPQEYILALVDAQDDELSNEEIMANLRQGLKEAIQGKVEPINTLWDDLDDE